MEYAIVLLLVAAVWHFIYQAIVLPSIHMKQRNQLFHLRDRLRAYHFETSDRRYEAAFDVAQDGINNAINSVAVLGLDMQVRIQRLQEDNASFRARVEARREALDAAKGTELEQIVSEANTVLKEIFVFNAGGWFIYVIPVAALCLFWQKIVTGARDLFAFESRDADRLFGRLDGAMCA